jgi:O-methyltransferase domain
LPRTRGRWVSSQPTYLGALVADNANSAAVYGVVALTRLPAARLTAQDWPVVLPVAQECVAQLGVTERMQTLSGDLRTVEFGGPYDAVFLSHILHHDPEETCREIVRKCLRVLAPGGCVIVIEFLAESSQPESTFSWLFSVMIHGTRGGRSFFSAEIGQLLTDGGDSRIEVSGGLPVGFVVGYRRSRGGKEGLVYIIDVAPGAAVPTHDHPRHELADLLEGPLTLEVEGKPAATLKACAGRGLAHEVSEHGT